MGYAIKISEAQKTAEAIAPIPSTSAGKYENLDTLAMVRPVRSTRITFLMPDSDLIILERILSKLLVSSDVVNTFLVWFDIYLLEF
jgi:hypothetical protein